MADWEANLSELLKAMDALCSEYHLLPLQSVPKPDGALHTDRVGCTLSVGISKLKFRLERVGTQKPTPSMEYLAAMTHEQIVQKIKEAVKLLRVANATISSTEAFSLISKFESEASLLSVLYFTRDQSMHLFLKARVLGFDGSESLTLVATDQDFCMVSLEGCRYEYCDENWTPEFWRNTERVEGTLTIIFPSNESLTLKALRGQAASDP